MPQFNKRFCSPRVIYFCRKPFELSGLLTTYNPSTGQEIVSYPAHDAKKVERALAAASQAFAEWKTLSLEARGQFLKAIAHELRKEKPYLAALAAEEMGKPMAQGLEEVEKCALTCEYFAEHGPAMLANREVPTEAAKSYVAYRPLGVILAVMPWNFPFWQVFRAFAPAVMAGNAMLLKHASSVCGCSLAIEKVIHGAGVPKGVFQSLLVQAARVGELIAHPDVAAVTLTGSTGAGREVAAQAGRHLKKAVLELGGSDAYVVLEDADLEHAAEVCVKGRLLNAGQSCISAKRFVVVKAVRKDFEKLVVAKMKAVKFGDPTNADCVLGPLARVELRDELHRQVADSMAQGAKLLCGGEVPHHVGAYYPPTVLSHVKPGMPAYSEELFGPVAVIIEAKDEADAMRIANDSDYGLGGCIFSGNVERAEKLAVEMMDAGSCFVNAMVRSDARLPFGGIKHSGYGRELGAAGILEFVNVKTVYIG